MITSTSDFHFIQVKAAILRLCMGCFLCSLIFEMHAAHAQPELDPFATGLNLISIKFAHYDAVQPVPYRFSASVAIADAASKQVRFGGTSSLPDYINMEKVKDWVASIRWNLTADDSRASLAPHLRIESSEALLEIKPIDRSVWMMWHRALD